jgi:hypothetical protein
MFANAARRIFFPFSFSSLDLITFEEKLSQLASFLFSTLFLSTILLVGAQHCLGIARATLMNWRLLFCFRETEEKVLMNSLPTEKITRSDRSVTLADANKLLR